MHTYIPHTFTETSSSHSHIPHTYTHFNHHTPHTCTQTSHPHTPEAHTSHSHTPHTHTHSHSRSPHTYTSHHTTANTPHKPHIHTRHSHTPHIPHTHAHPAISKLITYPGRYMKLPPPLSRYLPLFLSESMMGAIYFTMKGAGEEDHAAFKQSQHETYEGHRAWLWSYNL